MTYLSRSFFIAGLAAGIIFLVFACAGIPENASIDLEKVATPDWDYPIAPGVYYPSDEEIPEHPVRYYRARCWPGCHSGSSHGLYPDSELDYSPVYMTSTIDRLAIDD